MKKSPLFILTILVLIAVSYFVVFNDKPDECANSITCVEDISTTINNNEQATFLGNPIDVPQIELAAEIANSNVLGETIDSETKDSTQKHIYVDLDKQTVYAYDENKMYMQALVSTGRWGKTPTGEFKIWVKIRSTKMSGGSGNDYYYLPNVPYVMYFYNSQIPKARGYGFHGAYWHNNFGTEMSHGCINLRQTDAELLYNWASPTSVKSTTHATKADPGTSLSICNQVQIIEGAKPVCLD